MKKILKMLAICIGLFVLGMGVGILINYFGTEGLMNFLKDIPNKNLTGELTLIGFIAFDILMFNFCQINYAKARTLEKGLEAADDDEADEIYDKIEHLLNYPIMYGNILTIGNMFWFSAVLLLLDNNPWMKSHDNPIFIITIILFLFGMFYSIFIQRFAINAEKRLNPEKKGDVLDRNFQAEWLDSCDEAQKLAVYKASYSAYKTVNTMCSILWLVAFFGMMVFDTGLLAVIVICIIWGASNVVYCRTAMKLEKGQLK